MRSPSPAFDDQAASFDERAGLAADVRRAVARAVIELGPSVGGGPSVGVGPPAGARAVLEVGAGTGEIGLELILAGARYLGFDLSAAMLGQLAGRCGAARVAPRAVVADGDAPWPVAAGGFAVIFGSRSLHLLDEERAASETLRAASPGGASLLIGRVERDPDSVKSVMRKHMRDLLAARGQRTRAGGRRRADLVARWCERGAEPVATTAVAAWPVTGTARASIAAWRDKSTMGGFEPPAAVKAAVLAELQVFGEQTFGGLDVPVESEERYVIEGARLPPGWQQ